MPLAPRTIGQRTRTKRTPERRKNANARGYTYRWEKASRAWLIEQFSMGNVRCALCGKVLDGSRSDIHVDHKVDHKGDMQAFWDEANWQACHARCHSAKTARENGFGR